MDVVFNHTAVTESSWFNKTVPNYYYRQDEEGNFADGLPVATKLPQNVK